MKIKFKNGSIVKKGPLHKKIKKSQVIRIMDTEKVNQPNQQSQPTVDGVEVDPEKIQDEFLNTGRIGRRNALPDILDSHCETSTADLPLKLSALTTSDSSSSSNCPNQTTNSSSNNK